MNITVKKSKITPTRKDLLMSFDFEVDRIIKIIESKIEENIELLSQKVSESNINIVIGFENIYAKCPGPIGTKIVCNNKNKIYGNNILNSLGDLGFNKKELNIDSKYKDIYVCICHMESIKDVELYRELGVEKIASVICDSIIEAILNNKKKTRTRKKKTENGVDNIC